MGDQLLIQIATRIHRLINDKAKLLRIGGDEFLICMKCVKNMQEIENKIALLYTDFAKFYINEAERYPLSFSIGVAIAHGGDTFQQAYKQADAALYYVKNNKKGTYVIYENGQLMDVMHRIL